MEDKPRIPPGQHSIGHLLVRHVGVVPAFDPDNWDLQVDGEVHLSLIHISEPTRPY